MKPARFVEKSPRGGKVPRLHQELIQKRWRNALRIEQEATE